VIDFASLSKDVRGDTSEIRTSVGYWSNIREKSREQLKEEGNPSMTHRIVPAGREGEII
jgi:hypothetical protein